MAPLPTIAQVVHQNWARGDVLIVSARDMTHGTDVDNITLYLDDSGLLNGQRSSAEARHLDCDVRRI